MQDQQSKLWCVIPAAGIGRRMAADRPKQYLRLGGRSVMEWTLEKMAAVTGLSGIVVGVSPDDGWWADQHLPPDIAISPYEGGAERSHTVLNGLTALTALGAADLDAVLVHDAVRPCVNVADVNRLVATCGDSEHGGILGHPLADTLKRVGNNRISATVSRDQLWRALTPQLFALGSLRKALQATHESSQLVTDEAEAMERAGYTPSILDSDIRNIKITRVADLELARLWIEQ